MYKQITVWLQQVEKALEQNSELFRRIFKKLNPNKKEGNICFCSHCTIKNCIVKIIKNSSSVLPGHRTVKSLFERNNFPVPGTKNYEYRPTNIPLIKKPCVVQDQFLIKLTTEELLKI